MRDRSNRKYIYKKGKETFGEETTAGTAIGKEGTFGQIKVWRLRIVFMTFNCHYAFYIWLNEKIGYFVA